MTKCKETASCVALVTDHVTSLPVFAVAGLNLHRHKYCPQLPPTWDSWIDVLRLLMDSGASVHESFCGRPLGTFDLYRNDGGSKHLDFFRLLHEEHYIDFDVLYGRQGWSAVQTAVRAKDGAIEGLRMLRKWGVDLDSIMNDGRTFLHLAAEMATEPGVIQFLIESGCSKYIDKQDNWGWTPLHYAILSEFHSRSNSPFGMVSFLLNQGARTDLRGRYMPYVYGKQPAGEFTPLELSEILNPSIFNGLIQALRTNGQTIPLEWDEEPFEDAKEELQGPTCSVPYRSKPT